jgi:DNA-binding ferritin-like protein (Dps family)
MNLYDRMTGNDMTRAYQTFEKRVQALPADYQAAWCEIKKNLWAFSDLTGRNLTPILEGIIGLLEESAYENLPIAEVVGEDIEAFTKAVAGAEGAGTYRDKWRKQLNHNVAKRLAK